MNKAGAAQTQEPVDPDPGCEPFVSIEEYRPDDAEELPVDEAVAASWHDDADWALVARIAEGDQAALAALYRQMHGRLSRFITRITRDEAGADDIVNDVMLVVWQKAAETTPQARLSTWLFGIAYHKALKAQSRSHRRDGELSISEEMAEMIGEQDASFSRMESDQLALAAMGSLSPEQRAVMELVYHEGLNYSDIARLLACPENTVKTRMFHARRKLRALWPSLSGSVAGLSS